MASSLLDIFQGKYGFLFGLLGFSQNTTLISSVQLSLIIKRTVQSIQQCAYLLKVNNSNTGTRCRSGIFVKFEPVSHFVLVAVL